ncbi:unnamed protein product [Vitrella brassicaformis CCMP3155]|uniref:Uncharacterized protein n=1 Tax=Vitrella brassicaformis (strain CCMP3155) TaxID=1169540 RepID=A0A0G4GNX7_VITBC|nr:unnamed protein product [Vitrella brassicaformis CCMP3155]|eukprot:CEM31874.1 unnamed protein product [Vitrella brassicaformis CCMP3155]
MILHNVRFLSRMRHFLYDIKCRVKGTGEREHFDNWQETRMLTMEQARWMLDTNGQTQTASRSRHTCTDNGKRRKTDHPRFVFGAEENSFEVFSAFERRLRSYHPPSIGPRPQGHPISAFFAHFAAPAPLLDVRAPSPPPLWPACRRTPAR